MAPPCQGRRVGDRYGHAVLRFKTAGDFVETRLEVV